MIFTENNTTTTIGHCRATCLEKSKAGAIITTWELIYPRYIHAELLTHRMFSRNASSSRATPLKVTLAEVRNNPMFFNHVGLNQSGMVAENELSQQRKAEFFDDWKALASMVADRVEAMSDRYGIHKQVLNRALEPFLPIRTIVTATETENFFKLRLAKDAQPEIHDLAQCMLESQEKKWFSLRDKHLPYSEYFPEAETDFERVIRCTCACARVSVGKQNGTKTTFETDKKFFKTLFEKGHLSPFEHCAFSFEENDWVDNFYECVSLRNYMTYLRDDEKLNMKQIFERVEEWANL